MAPSSKYLNISLDEDDEYDSDSLYSDVELNLPEDIESVELPVLKEKPKTGPVMYALFYFMGAMIILSSTTFGFVRDNIYKLFGCSKQTNSSRSYLV